MTTDSVGTGAAPCRRGGPHEPRDQHLLASNLIWTDAFVPPWGANEDVLVAASGSPALVDAAFGRLVETSPATHFRLMTNAPVATPVDKLPLSPSWDPSRFTVAWWRAIVFITEDENLPDHRNALHYLISIQCHPLPPANC